MRRSVWSLVLVTAAMLVGPALAVAHPLTEDALDVVIGRDRIVMDARISPEQVRVVESGGPDTPPFLPLADMIDAHGAYVLSHLHVKVDGKAVSGRLVAPTTAPAVAGTGSLATYRIEYAVAAPPAVVRIDQDFLREFDGWSASCAVRVRQEDEDSFDTALLTRERSVEFGCDWSTDKGRRDARNPVATRVRFWPAAWAYFVHGVGHIIGPIDGGRWDWREAGLDHLLFAAALVLGLRRLSDLLLVITAFTLAHTTTLTLSILNLVHVSPRIVEPMIAASIVCTAMQNVFWPEVEGGGHRRIWLRLAPAFAFGLFHGLGFAGGLRDAMSQMPASALGAALGGFTVGVEAGHQVVVLPLFGALYALRHYRAPRPRTALSEAVLRYGSCAITAGGFYFLIQAIR